MSRPMRSLNDWISFIKAQPCDAIVFNLNRIRCVGQQLNLLNWSIPIITTTGTNGKGTCAFLLENIYKNAAYKTGLFHSPYLFRYEEQIRINGASIDERQLCDAFAVIEKARGNILLTLFEFTTLAALLLFRQHNLDVIILEVGMGGLHDATNIVPPNLVVVTNIEMDHKQWLGQTREAIAFEKFGLVRCNTPVIYADTKPVPQTITETLKIKKTVLYQLGKDFSLPAFNVPLSLAKSSVAAAVMTIKILQKKLPVRTEDIQKIILKTQIAGRFQTITHPIMQVFDIAHNPAAAKLLAKKLKTQRKYSRNIAVFSMFGDKDIQKTIVPLLNIIDEWHISTLNHPRAASLDQLKNFFTALKIKTYYAYPSLLTAYQTALSLANQNDRVIIFGSCKIFENIGITHLSNST